MSALSNVSVPAATIPTAVFNAAPVATVWTDDGVLVRLSGRVGAAEVAELRASLLRRRPAGCDDVIVDAGDLTEADDSALAVLLAADSWARDTGGRLRYSRIGAWLRNEMVSLGLADAMHELEGPGQRRVP